MFIWYWSGDGGSQVMEDHEIYSIYHTSWRLGLAASESIFMVPPRGWDCG